VAVLEVEVGAGVKQEEQASLTDVLVGALTDAEAWQLMTARDLVTLVGLEQKRELLGCSDSSCFVELAGTLGADGVVIVSVGIVNGQTIAAGRVLNPTSAAVLARATVVAGEGNLVATIRRIGQAVRRAYREARGLKPLGGAVSAQLSSCGSALDCDAECRASSPSACARLGGLLLAGKRPPAAIAAALQRACELGDVASCLGAASSWETAGQLGSAIDPLRRACLAPLEPVAPACGRGGSLLLEGKVVARDAEQGLLLLRRGCVEGDAPACLALGLALQPAGGGPPDAELAASALDLSCRGGLTAGCIELASVCLAGRGAPPDRPRGDRAATRSCELLGPGGCLAAADTRLKSGEPALALALRRALCEADLPAAGEACAGAAMLLIEGPVTIRELGEGAALARRGCDRGDGQACLLLTRAEVEASRPGSDLTGAVARLRRLSPCDQRCVAVAASILLRSKQSLPTAAAAQGFVAELCHAGNGAACGLAANASLSGRGVAPDEAKGLALFEQGCKLGHPESCQAAAGMLQEGQGAARNQGLADWRLKRACALGLKEACR
jgi:TPR repeat protein